MKAAALHFSEGTRESTRDTAPTTLAARHSWPVTMLGLPFDNISAGDVLTRLEAMTAACRPFRVATINLELLVNALANPGWRQTLAGADLLLCDSRALLCASRWLGNRLAERVEALAFAKGAMRLCALRGFRVFVVDCRPGAAGEFADHLTRAAPGVQIVGTYSPQTPDGAGSRGMDSLVRVARPDILFERIHPDDKAIWIGNRHQELGVPVCVQCCLGDADLRRLRPLMLPHGAAPDNLLRPAAEKPACFRQRIVRFLKGARNALTLAPEFLQQWACMSHGRSRSGAAAVVNASTEWLDLDAGTALTRSACDFNAALWERVETHSTHCAIDVSRVRQIDATGLAVLALCKRAVNRAGKHFVLAGPTESVRLALAAALLWPMFDVAATLREAHDFAPSHFQAQPGVTRSLAWCGEIIAANADDVWHMTAEYVRTFAASGSTLVVIDLSRLRTVDLAGAALMVRIMQFACTLRIGVLFAHPSAPVVRVLQNSGADRLLLDGAQ